MKKELPYILLSLVLCSILIFYPLSFDLVLLEGTLGTNAHDTYFVVDPTYHIISSCIISFAFVYFLRVLFTSLAIISFVLEIYTFFRIRERR